MRSSAIKRWQSCQCCSSLTWRWPSRSRGLFGIKSAGHGLLVNVAAPLPVGCPAEPGSILASSLPKRHCLKSGQRKVGEGWTQAEAWALLVIAGHRPHLVQCGPDEPSWTWTQTWVKARVHNNSLNWTARSSAIQGWQWCSWVTRR